MKRSIFSFGVYRDGLKQLRLIGFMSLVILLLEAVLLPLGTALTTYRQQNYGEIMSLLRANPLLLLVFFVVTPLMTLNLFGFLNRRNSSDFYHAIPHKRQCIYVSFAASVLTWVMGIVAVTTLVSAVACMVLPNCTLIMRTIPITWFSIGASCVLIIGAVLISMSLTGTGFTNVLVTLMILFVPRLFITSITSVLNSELPFVVNGSFGLLLEGRYNIVTGCLFSVFTGEDSGFNNLGSGIYTLILGLIYLGIGALFFVKRKSESAGQSAVSRRMQTVFRLTAAMVVCLIPCILIFSMLVEHTVTVDNLFSLAVLYIVALVVYFLYELITTRKWRNLIKAIPGIAILALLNLILIGGMYGGYHSVVSSVLSADQISSVRIISEYGNGAYFSERCEQIDIRDEEVKEIIAGALNETIKQYQTGRYYWMDSMNPHLTVEIRTGLWSIYRRVIVSEKEIETIAEYLERIPEYQEIYRELPDIGDQYTSVHVGDLTEQEAADIYEVMRREVQEIDFGQWYRAIKSGSDGNEMFTLNMDTVIGAKGYSQVFYVGQDLPKTCQKYLEIISGKGRQQKFLEQLVEVMEPGAGEVDAYLELSLYTEAGSREWNWYNFSWYEDEMEAGEAAGIPSLTDEQQEAFETLAEFLQKKAGDVPSLGEDILILKWEYYGYGSNSTDYERIEVGFSLSDEVPEYLKMLIYGDMEVVYE